jgi:hypothetical protein
VRSRRTSADLRSGGRASISRPRPLPLDIEQGARVSILWIIIIVVLVLAVLGFFGRGRF